jgi:hypothetical protein
LANNDDNALEVPDLSEFGHDALHRKRFELRVERWQDQPDGLVPGKLLEIGLEPLNAVRGQTMQGGDHSALIEVRHRSYL